MVEGGNSRQNVFRVVGWEDACTGKDGNTDTNADIR
jgi:hypothetical protein